MPEHSELNQRVRKMEIVRADHVSITYDGVKNAVDDVSFSVKKGQIIGTASLTDQGQTLATVSLIAAEDVPERSFRYGFRRLLSVWPLADE